MASSHHTNQSGSRKPGCYVKSLQTRDQSHTDTRASAPLNLASIANHGGLGEKFKPSNHERGITCRFRGLPHTDVTHAVSDPDRLLLNWILIASVSAKSRRLMSSQYPGLSRCGIANGSGQAEINTPFDVFFLGHSSLKLSLVSMWTSQSLCQFEAWCEESDEGGRSKERDAEDKKKTRRRKRIGKNEGIGGIAIT